MQFSSIEYFLLLCEEKNITKVAAKLYMTQQGLSKAIKRLEHELGFPLFERRAGGLHLTHQGRMFRQTALEFRELHKRMQKSIERLRNERKSVRVGVTMGVLLGMQQSELNDLKQALAPLELELVDMMDYTCERAVENAEVDFGITVAPLDPVLFFEVPLKRRSVYAVVPEGHPLSDRKVIHFDDLKDEPLIMANNNFKSHHSFIAKCEDHGFRPNILSTTMETMMIYTRSRQGQGIGISSDLPLIDAGLPGVKLVPFRQEEFSILFSFFTARAQTLSDQDKQVRDILVRQFK